jgi:UDP-N-acetylglucosamine acyltransferase
VIHPTAVIEKGAELADDVEIGPYCVIGGKVRIGKRTRLVSHVIITGRTEIGEDCIVQPFASIGGDPQDISYKGEDTACIIGDHNVIGEYVTINKASTKADLATRVGNRNFIMAYSHIGHDCIVGNDVQMANAATLAGHVHVADFAIVSGLVAVHQFCKIGRFAMVSGLTGVPQDIPPFVMAAGDTAGSRATLHGLNVIGLKRHGFSIDDITTLKKAYRLLFRVGLSLETAVQRIEQELEGDYVGELVDFIRSSERGICR